MFGAVLAFGQEFVITSDWEVRAGGQTVRVRPAEMVTVTAERYVGVPMFNPKVGGWVKGMQLKGVRAQETTSPRLLDGESFHLRAGPGENEPVFIRGVDYEIDLEWGTFGRLTDSRIDEGGEVYASYRHWQLRLDAVVATASGQIVLREGIPKAAAPMAEAAKAGERHLGNIYLPGFVKKLAPEHLFPVLEREYPELPRVANATVDRIMKRLRAGEAVRILAWGDSVTDGGYLPAAERWQEQFVVRLRERFPKARIEMVTQAWGGRNTGSYLAEPAGSAHNYRETVLGLKPDLIISEFVNDARLEPAQVEERYGRLLADFKGIGAEWIILTPHYVRPDWMGLTREREIDEDPRPYVKGLREFAARNDVGLADASLRYGRLWRQGVPYNTLMVNAINHPDSRGMTIFADALMALFRD